MSFQLRKASNFVPILGWCNTTIVLEQAIGTLSNTIENAKRRREKVSVERALEMSLDVVKGVQHMHTLPGGPITHGDIDSKQFLFNKEGALMLSDLDRMQYTGYSSTNRKCQFRPEVVAQRNYGPFDEKYDINRTGLILQTLSSLPAINEDEMDAYPQAMNNLIAETLHANPIKRPSASEMVQRINAILRHYKASHVHSHNRLP